MVRVEDTNSNEDVVLATVGVPTGHSPSPCRGQTNLCC
ncbi:hypothetical protein Patl1_05443 [Pistacia atlantica]|uniref:Uncharacterized protein n=1 Tax=Pistacia atlantica TaxID=434234 RepID=A0ACC1BUT2_9ROSI|nr:hypothetical protein Patl1_05443 [Pistacia atlantica]